MLVVMLVGLKKISRRQGGTAGDLCVCGYRWCVGVGWINTTAKALPGDTRPPHERHAPRGGSEKRGSVCVSKKSRK